MVGISDDNISIPAHIAICPYCEGALVIDPYEWEMSGKPTGYHTLCPTFLNHSDSSQWCQWTYQDGVEIDAAIDEWLAEQYPEEGNRLCEVCSGDVDAESLHDSKLLGTLIRCRTCILSVAPELVGA